MNYRPLWVTILPAERRARHPYQVAVMVLMLVLGTSQLAVGPVVSSSLNSLPHSTVTMLNWFCILGGTAGIAAAFIPERMVKVWKWEADATWLRLWVEFGCHGLLATVWVSYFISIVSTYDFVQGLSLGTGACIVFTGAALVRAFQIMKTIKMAVLDRPGPAVITGMDSLGSADD